MHHHIKNPLKRNGGLLVNLVLFLSQKLSIFFIRNFADALLVYDTREGRNLRELISNKDLAIYFIKNGINRNLIDGAQVTSKIYAACFLGGIRPSKGINDFVPLWQKVVNKFPEAKFLVIGSGSEATMNKLKTEIVENKLEKNIILHGPQKSDRHLFELVKSCKLFVFPSYEEGWGIALCEAMYCELPILCYALPAFETFGKELDAFELGDYAKIAQKAIYYLEQPSEITTKGKILKHIASKYTWKPIAEEEDEILNSLIRN